MDKFLRYLFERSSNDGGLVKIKSEGTSNERGHDLYKLETSNEMNKESKALLKMTANSNKNGDEQAPASSCEQCGCSCVKSPCTQCRAKNKVCRGRERRRRSTKRKRSSSRSRSKSRTNEKKAHKMSSCRLKKRRKSQTNPYRQRSQTNPYRQRSQTNPYRQRSQINPCRKRNRSKCLKEYSKVEIQEASEPEKMPILKNEEIVKQEVIKKQEEMSEKEVQTEKREQTEKEVQTEKEAIVSQAIEKQQSPNPCCRKGDCACYATSSFLREMRKSCSERKQRQPERCIECGSATRLKKKSRTKNWGGSRATSQERERCEEMSIRGQFVDKKKGNVFKYFGEIASIQGQGQQVEFSDCESRNYSRCSIYRKGNHTLNSKNRKRIKGKKGESKDISKNRIKCRRR